MQLLVTGGAGFVGSNFIHLVMRETNHRVVNLDLLTYAGNRANCAAFETDPRYRFVRGDIADQRLVESLLREHAVEVIVNFAAESHVDRSIHDAAAFIRTNVMGAQALLDAARACGVRRLMHVSTDEVYGETDDRGPRFTEGSPLKPSSPYAASKAAADLLVLAACRTHRQPALITRSSNNYGPYQHPEKFIPITILRATRNEPIPVYGTGANVRDWIHVEDHCRGILAAIERGRDGEIYNFGGNCERRNSDVARAILRLLGRPESLIRFVADRPGHDRRYAIDFAKAADELGWGPKTDFSDGLARTIEWYRENEAWLATMASEQFEQFCRKHSAVGGN